MHSNKLKVENIKDSQQIEISSNGLNMGNDVLLLWRILITNPQIVN